MLWDLKHPARVIPVRPVVHTGQTGPGMGCYSYNFGFKYQGFKDPARFSAEKIHKYDALQ